jgi:hypothetical protein
MSTTRTTLGTAAGTLGFKTLLAKDAVSVASNDLLGVQWRCTTTPAATTVETAAMIYLDQ